MSSKIAKTEFFYTKNNKKASKTTDPLQGFSYSTTIFEDLTNFILQHAKKLGASDAAAFASEATGLNVSVRMGELETIERNQDKSLSITVYIDKSCGSAATSDFSKAALEQAAQAAYDIARYTAQDEAAGLPDTKETAKGREVLRDLDLFHPWVLSTDDAMVLALECEQAALNTHQLVSNSEGASVSVQQSHFFSAHTHGFKGGYATSRHSVSVAPIAGSGDNMQRDAWFSSQRSPKDLAQPSVIGRYAAQRALSRLGARKISTRECAVLFEAPLAAGLLGSLVQALSGGALYRKSTFLLNSLGKQILPKHIDVYEDPFILRGKGSCPFDGEGVRVKARHVIEKGVVQGYFLGSYSARKLGMKTTGNAGGSHNLSLTSRLTKPHDDLQAMLRKLGTGLFVTELMGSGVNGVTGDYSRGANGFWVENGVIAYPVHEITIAGNLKTMFMDIVGIGADVYVYGAKSTGSVLIEKMMLAGS